MVLGDFKVSGGGGDGGICWNNPPSVRMHASVLSLFACSQEYERRSRGFLFCHLSLSLSICIQDRLLDRHLCPNLYPCVLKVQSVSQSVSRSVSFSWLLLRFCLTSATHGQNLIQCYPTPHPHPNQQSYFPPLFCSLRPILL